MAEDSYELLIVGGGMTGLVSAQRYLDVHPDARVGILEKEGDIGGVFSRRRNHSNFWTQWSHGHSEFADLSMPRPPEGDIRHDYYKSIYVTKYLESYASRKDTQGRTLRDRIIFNISVQSVKKIDGRWTVSGTETASDTPRVFTTTRIIVASGLDTHPSIPHFKGQETFKGPIIHSIDFGVSGEPKLPDPSIKNITVLGAGKSSADMIYEAVTKYKKNVTWIIRKSGTGAAFFADGKGRAGYKNAFELASSRVVSYLGPSIWYENNRWTKFINGPGLGTTLQKQIVGAMDKDTRKLANYHGRNTGKGFEGLEYDVGMWWQSGPGGLIHHDDFWDVIANNVQVYRDEISHLSEGAIHLAGGTEVPTDMLLAGTGWIPSLEFFDEETLVQLGLPHKPEAESIELTEKWKKLESDADAQIVKDFPILANPPPHFKGDARSTTYRLYKGMAPIGDPSILILNHVVTGNKMLGAEVQAMWGVAYFNGDVPVPSVQDQEKETARLIAYSKRRYLSTGQLGNAMNFDTITYADNLFRQMGLHAHEKKGFKATYLQPFMPADVGKAWNEYVQRARGPAAKAADVESS